MGKSPASCFKIIGCGGDSVDHDDLQTPESKGSSDRRKWSFRKRSARDRVLSNNVGSETPQSATKETLESPAVNFHVQPDLSVPEKTSIIQLKEEKTTAIQLTEEKSSVIQLIEEKSSVIQLTDEKTESPAQLESKSSDTLSASEDDYTADEIPDEPSIIIIQAGIRRLLAEQVLLRHKNIIKLQAAVRGHIVRRHAVGTLRCVQAIIKMQALVRARCAGRLEKVTGDSFRRSETSGKGKREAKSNAIYTYVSIEKLLSNAFARQLMESTPRTKHINIKCDPSKSDTAWKWLERWMSVSSVSHEGSPESGSPVEHHNENLVHSDIEEDILALSECYAESADLTSGMEEVVKEVSENDDNLTIVRELNDTSLHLDNITQLKSGVAESAPTKMKGTDFIEVAQVESLSEKGGTGNLRDSEQPETVAKKLSKKASNPAFIEGALVESLSEKGRTGNLRDCEQPETEAKKLSKKASNPAFIAAQSKFKELSSVPTSTKLTTLSSHTLGVESGLDKVSPATSAVQISSECGTELSISSTLDSPDRSVNGIEHETKVASIVTEVQPKSGEIFETEATDKSPTLETDLSFTSKNDSKMYESVIDSAIAPLDSIKDEDLPRVEKKQEANLFDRQLDLESEKSPRSHITVPESQTTPSSHVLIKPKKIKGQTSEPSLKKRSSSADKNRNQDSGLRSSLEQLPEPKSGKRRNSFGSAKPEHEPRDSSSSNPLPSYMQATESAKAKALIIANGSPRSSPDVLDKDIYIKKRHSLPGNNDRQGSPRIQRSMSQVQQSAKGNATNSPQDRKWRR